MPKAHMPRPQERWEKLLQHDLILAFFYFGNQNTFGNLSVEVFDVWYKHWYTDKSILSFGLCA